MNDELDNTIKTNAEGPAKASGDASSHANMTSALEVCAQRIESIAARIEGA